MSTRKWIVAALAALLGLCVLLAVVAVPRTPAAQTADVAILMYHAFTEDEADTGSLCTLASEFARQLSALRDAGYTSVGYADLIEFVNGEGKLPEKPLLISIDDGYQNNLDLAAPLLETYGFCANIAVIGVSIGHTTYKDTDIPITPHFSLEDARPWVARGVLTVTTHSYDMHQVTAVDGAGCRRGVLQMPGEAEPDYIAALTQDYTRARTACRAAGHAAARVHLSLRRVFRAVGARAAGAGCAGHDHDRGRREPSGQGRAGNAPAAAPHQCARRHGAGCAPEQHRRRPAGAALTPRPTLPVRADRSAAACMGGGRLP